MPSDVLYTQLNALICQQYNGSGGPITYQFILYDMINVHALRILKNLRTLIYLPVVCVIDRSSSRFFSVCGRKTSLKILHSSKNFFSRRRGRGKMRAREILPTQKLCVFELCLRQRTENSDWLKYWPWLITAMCWIWRPTRNSQIKKMASIDVKKQVLANVLRKHSII